MTKRAAGKFERRERDFYLTPEEPVLKLLPHLLRVQTFAEPMCGDGAIVHVLERLGWECKWASDLEPQNPCRQVPSYEMFTMDVFSTDLANYNRCDAIISNPPWPAPNGKGDPTVSIIEHLMAFKPTWLLLSSDFAHNRYFEDLANRCQKIVSVGRVSWQHNGKKGFDNAAWYLFDNYVQVTGPIFYANRDAEAIFNPMTTEDLL